MKSWFLEKSTQAILLISLGVAFLYHNSFTSPFFQDDKLLLQLSRNDNPFIPIAHFPYRPISINMFYSLGQVFFRIKPFGFHLLEFLAFMATLFCIYYLVLFLTKNIAKSLVTVILYAFNISLFANFYWIATSYFSLGSLFFFAAVLCFIKEKMLTSVILFFFALGSNEISFVIPVLLSVISYLLKIPWRKVIPFWVIGVISFFLRMYYVGFPQVPDYQVKINIQVFSTFRWYLLRALNLPEGVDRVQDPILWICFSVIIFLLVLSMIRYAKLKEKNLKLITLGAFWFTLGALPFYFIPGHISSYYLTVALFGPTIIIAEIVTNFRILQIFILFYILLSLRGLDFLHATHWIILKNTGPIGKFYNF